MLLLAITGTYLFVAEPEPRVEKAAVVDFKGDVKPILEMKCNRCHMPGKLGGKLDTTTLKSMLKGGESGPALEPGQPDKSLLVELIHFNEMPPKRVKPRVMPDELKVLKAWIAAGARE
jgi:Planctomycete cytochrome C